MNWTRWKMPPSTLGGRLHGQRLGEARDALDQQVAAGEQADEDALEHRVLAGDDRAGSRRARPRGARAPRSARVRRRPARSRPRLGSFSRCRVSRAPPARSDPRVRAQHTSLRVRLRTTAPKQPANEPATLATEPARAAGLRHLGRHTGGVVVRSPVGGVVRDQQRVGHRSLHAPRLRAGGEGARDRRGPSPVARERRVHAVGAEPGPDGRASGRASRRSGAGGRPLPPRRARGSGRRRSSRACVAGRCSARRRSGSFRPCASTVRIAARNRSTARGSSFVPRLSTR